VVIEVAACHAMQDASEYLGMTDRKQGATSNQRLATSKKKETRN
jgi:hypothetical protein